MKEAFALSTSWNIFRYTDAKTFVKEITATGINRVELNYRVTRKIIEEIMPFIECGELAVSSLHNYCPRPDIPDGIRSETVLSSLNEEFRRAAVGFTLDTLDFANLLGVKTVVIHTGKIIETLNYDEILRGLYIQGKMHTDDYKRVKSRLVWDRSRKSKPYVAACEKSIEEISEYIGRMGYDIKLGLENRYYYYEIPMKDEYEVWFEKYKGYPVGLWYDIGHGEVLDNLMLADSREILQKYRQNLLGLHIHDTEGLSDHYAPGMKKTNFNCFAEFLRMDIIKVLELRSDLKTEDIMSGARYLDNILLNQ